MSNESDKERKGTMREAAERLGFPLASPDDPIYKAGYIISVPVKRVTARQYGAADEGPRRYQGSLPHQYPWLDCSDIDDED